MLYSVMRVITVINIQVLHTCVKCFVTWVSDHNLSGRSDMKNITTCVIMCYQDLQQHSYIQCLLYCMCYQCYSIHPYIEPGIRK